MRIKIICTFYILLCLILNSRAQTTYSDVTLKSLNSKNITIDDLTENKNIVVISFWATWCKPCISELDAISENIEEWQDKVDFAFIAISIDDARSSSKVKSLINGKGWEFDIALDKNQEFKRSLGINNIPFSVIIRNGKVEYKHAGYFPGDEENLWDKIQELND